MLWDSADGLDPLRVPRRHAMTISVLQGGYVKISGPRTCFQRRAHDGGTFWQETQVITLSVLLQANQEV